MEECADVVLRARALLGRTLTAHGVTARITEVEAYGGRQDPASHAFVRTPRSEIMYGPANRLYVYRSYGIHHCANVVTGPTEVGAAVLLRAGVIIEGVELARARRGLDEMAAGSAHLLARGPGNLARALGLTTADLGVDLAADGPVFLGPEVDAAVAARHQIAAGPRVGVARAADVPWRFWLVGEPSVSAYRRSPRAPRPDC